MVRKLNKDGKSRPNIVIPTIRSKPFFTNFLKDWGEEFAGCHLIVIEDRKEKQLLTTMNLYSDMYNFTYELYDWRDIDKDLGKDSWIIPRQTDCVRNYGYLMAYKNQPEFIVTLDDDLKPLSKGHIMAFYNNLFQANQTKKQNLQYFSTMNADLPRGVLIDDEEHEIVVSHGTWVENADYSAKQQIKRGHKVFGNLETDFYSGQIPQGCLYSMCGMNLAWKTWFTRHMYFPLMGEYDEYPIDRCGDIWAGYYSKYIADTHGVSHFTGYPMVIHNRASNPWTNLKKEKNEDVLGKEFINVMIHGKEPTIQVNYFTLLKKAYNIWNKLIDEVDKQNDNSSK